MSILTLMSYILFASSLLCSAVYQAVIVLMAFGRRVDIVQGSEAGISKSLSIVIPSKREPLDIVMNNLNRLSRMSCFDEILLVLDDPLDYVANLIRSLDTAFFDKGGFVIARVNGFGGRCGALSDGAKLSLGQNILVEDVDTIPSEAFLCKARECRDVCIAIWEPYVESRNRVEEGMAFITRFGSWVFYELRSRLGLFLYPLGSGSVIDKQLLKSIGFWRPDVVQDDIWLGYELIRIGVKPRLIKERMYVGVPKTLEGVRIQQCRWSYGSTNVFSRFIAKILSSPIKFIERVEAAAYSLQPVTGALALLSFLIAMFAAVLEKEVALSLAHLIPIAIALVIQGSILSIFASQVYGFSRWKTAYLSGRVGAMYTMLSPLIGYYALKGLIRARYSYKITPKVVKAYRRKYIDVVEAISIALSLPTLALSIINRNTVTLFISASLALPTLYSIIRLEKG